MLTNKSFGLDNEGKVLAQPGGHVKLRFTRNTIVRGKPYAEGDVSDVPEHDAHTLLAIKKAVRVPVEIVTPPETITTRDPKPDSRDARVRK